MFVGGAIPVTIQRASIRELLGALTVPERSAITTVSPPAPKRSSGLSLFRAVKSTRAAPRPYHAPVRNNVLPVGYTTLEAPAPLLDQVDRKSVVKGKSVSVRVDLGGRRIINKQTKQTLTRTPTQHK